MNITEALKRFLALVVQSMLDAESRRREAYLARSTDLADLERRQREFAREPGLLSYHDNYLARG